MSSLAHHTPWLAFAASGDCVVRFTTVASASSGIHALPSNIRVSGGPQAVLVTSPASPRLRPYFLGVLHQRQRPKGSDWGVYVHWAYAFSRLPPFQVLGVSKVLPLVSRPQELDSANPRENRAKIAFASGLVVQQDTGMVVVAYGAGDDRSLLYKVPLAELEEQLFPNLFSSEPAPRA